MGKITAPSPSTGTACRAVAPTGSPASANLSITRSASKAAQADGNATIQLRHHPRPHPWMPQPSHPWMPQPRTPPLRQSPNLSRHANRMSTPVPLVLARKPSCRSPRVNLHIRQRWKALVNAPLLPTVQPYLDRVALEEEHREMY